MGLEQYIRAGAVLDRSFISLQTNVTGSGSVDLGSAYVLLSISTTAPCRLRLYDMSQSLEDTTERSRAFINTNVPDNIALIGDFSMSVAGTYTIDPVLYGMVNRTDNRLTYYRVNNTQSGAFPNITFNRYKLEDAPVSTQNRKTLPLINGFINSSSIVTGSISSTNIPRTYILVSASVSGSSTRARLRLYTTSASLSNQTELSRSFSTESSNTSQLIVDMILSGSQTTYFVPKIIGANLQNMGTNLNVTRTSQENIMGRNELYYILQNVSTQSIQQNISASVHVFALED